MSRAVAAGFCGARAGLTICPPSRTPCDPQLRVRPPQPPLREVWHVALTACSRSLWAAERRSSRAGLGSWPTRRPRSPRRRRPRQSSPARRLPRSRPPSTRSSTRSSTTRRRLGSRRTAASTARCTTRRSRRSRRTGKAGSSCPGSGPSATCASLATVQPSARSSATRR